MYYGEKFNAFTHLGAAVLALPAAIVLIVLASLDGDAWRVVSISIYGLTLVLLYSFSTLYHSLRGRHKIVLRKLDHESIYLLIVGSYTPFCLVTLRGPWGWSLFGVVWGLGVIGGVQELRPIGQARILSVVIYLVMGWVALVARVGRISSGGRASLPGNRRASLRPHRTHGSNRSSGPGSRAPGGVRSSCRQAGPKR